MKKIAAAFLTLFIFLFATAPVFAQKQYVVDDAMLFSSDQLQHLGEYTAQLSETYDIDVVVVTTADTGGKEAYLYANDYFDDNGYGIGDDRSGVLLLFDMDNREVYISTLGWVIDLLTDVRTDALLDDAYVYMSDGEYYLAALAFLDGFDYYAGLHQSGNDGHRHVVDDSHLYTESQLGYLENYLAEASAAISTELAIYTVFDTGDISPRDFAMDFYQRNQYGYGSNRTGILLLIANDTGEVYIWANGDATTSLTESQHQQLSDDIRDAMVAGNSYDAAILFADGVQRYYRQSGDGTSNATEDFVLESREILLAAAAAIVAGLVFFLVTLYRYRVHFKSSRYAYRENASLGLTQQEDVLIGTNVTQRRIQTDSYGGGGGSSGGRGFGSSGGGSFSGGSRSSSSSSSGRSHGGGGRKF